MKTAIIAAALFSLTATGVALHPGRDIGPTPPTNLPHIVANGKQKVEVVFVLDTTGSMGGLIEAAKEKIWSIASTMASANSAPEIRMGLVAYRDRGDDYVTQVIDLSSDLDSMYAKLMDFQAGGGGDGPESVNQALHDAVNRISWSQDPKSYKAIFLVGDAAPHMDYQDDVKYPVSIAQAKERGIVVNSIQCGQLPDTRQDWLKVAQLGGGRYFEVEQSGSALAIATPFDKDLARVAKELDETRVYYGTEKQRAEKRQKTEATDKLHKLSSVASQARRAAFNASDSGRANFLGDSELVDDVATGKVDLSKVDKNVLPPAMQAMSPEARQAELAAKADKRNELKKEAERLSRARGDYLEEKAKETDGAAQSLDYKLYDAIREQAASKGLRYESGPKL